MNTNPDIKPQPITRDLVPEDHRLYITEQLFGIRFPLQLEPFIYAITEKMAPAYHGGFWEFYTLSNGGFYMAPDLDQTFEVYCENYFQGELSADALGITSCLYAYSRLSFGGGIAQMYARQYHLLREYMLEHPEAAAILGATD
jgi:hypothetical protein